jgi:hypothetical protein
MARGSCGECGRLGAARAKEPALMASAAMDGESAASSERAKAWRAAANVRRLARAAPGQANRSGVHLLPLGDQPVGR